ncbi:MAG: glycoside hydrolase family 127 protein [Salana multivorans]|nr:glycoside hydrolase family 127 protein [Salana multivorans]
MSISETSAPTPPEATPVAPTTPATPAAPAPPAAPVAPGSGALRPLGLGDVRLTGGFWGGWQEVNATGIIPHADAWEERIGWVDNFRRALDGTLVGHRTGREFSDSDVYKLLEAMAWEHGRTGDAALDARIREVAALIARVQEPDGYLSTRFGRPGQGERYSDLEWGHELYCYGHLVQAAVARLRTGVHDELVDVALRAADHVCAEFGPGGPRDGVCGHPEIEPALVELYRVTGEPRYLETARAFVERRGHRTLADIEFGRAYFQDDVPVREASDLRGHAVRALYLSAGALDVAVETGDEELFDVVREQYRRALARRTYLTGGMGSHHQDEAFGEDFELPPDRAYAETCASVASIMVAWRLLLATGDAAWGDVVERALHNVVVTSPAADGRSFFYTNPLQMRVEGAPVDPDELSPRAHAQLRAPWFEVSCCPTNVARTLAQLATYVATASDDGIQLHQLAPATIDVELPDAGRVRLEVVTGYPYAGEVEVRVLESRDAPWELAIRVPAWAVGAATLDGEPVPGDGRVARVRRTFRSGETVRLALPMAPRVVGADPRVDAVRGCVAVERGPFVLAAESVDLDGADVGLLRVDSATVRAGEEPGTALVDGVLLDPEDAAWPYGPGAPTEQEGGRRVTVVLRPCFGWGERGPATMRVWLPTR